VLRALADQRCHRLGLVQPRREHRGADHPTPARRRCPTAGRIPPTIAIFVALVGLTSLNSVSRHSDQALIVRDYFE
jgi:hypothetical protein